MNAEGNYPPGGDARGSRARVIVRRAQTMTVLSSFPKEISADAHPKYPGAWRRRQLGLRFRSCLTCLCSLLSLWCKAARCVSDLHYAPHGSVSDCTRSSEKGRQGISWQRGVHVCICMCTYRIAETQADQCMCCY